MYWMPLLLVAALSSVHAQQTAQTRIAETLRECYSNPDLLDRNNLPPLTMSVLIDIIRKIEDNPDVNMDLRQLSTVLLHTYRQDGIEFHQPEISASLNVLPFAPTYYSFHRNRLLLTRLIPNNLQVLGNDTISSVHKCTIHQMLSITVDKRVRGDENKCNALSQYRALRTARSSRSISEDVEIMKPNVLKSANKNGKLRRYDPNNDVEFSDIDSSGVKSERQVAESTCPLLNGVVNTAWGPVSAGNVIAGIAAGAQPQQVNIQDLVRDLNVRYRNVQQTVSSLYPATIAGDLAEAVLIQGTERGSTTVSIGAPGTWNSSQAPRYYMLQRRVNIEMADPAIRGDIDGFVLGSTISAQLGAYSSLKLSQVLDMFYSPRNGAFDSNLRACNRRALLDQYITDDNLVSQTNAFATALDTNLPLRGTMIAGLEQLVQSSVANLRTYTTNNLNDLSCTTTLAQSNDFHLKTNLYIALDSSWSYQAVYPAISYLVDSIEVGKFGSSITLLNAFDGQIVINTTFSPADFYAAYNTSRHASITPGVNLGTSLMNIKLLMQESLQNESARNYVGGNSTVLLYLINTANLQTSDTAWQQANEINNTVPDLRVLYASSSNQFDNLWSYVRDMHNDIFTISLNTEGTNVETTINPVLQRIQSVGRRIINPTCGFLFNGLSSGTRQFDDYVDPGFTNFYRISPNYFFGNNDNRKIRVSRTGTGVGNLIVCHSRSVEQPRNSNSTAASSDTSSTTCQTLTSGNVEIGLQNPCDGWGYINECPPFFLSVQSDTSLPAGSYASAACTDPGCRFPFSIKYQVQVEELGCYNGASTVTASLLILFTTIYVTLSGSS